MDGPIRVSQVPDTDPPIVKVILDTKPSSKEVVLPNGLAVVLCKGLQHVLGDQVATTKLTDGAIKETGELRELTVRLEKELSHEIGVSSGLTKTVLSLEEVSEKRVEEHRNFVEQLGKEKAASDDAHAKESEDFKVTIKALNESLLSAKSAGASPSPNPGADPTTPAAAPHSAPPEAQSPTSPDTPI